MKNAKRFSWSEFFEEKDRVNQTNDGRALSTTTGSKSYYVYFCNFEDCKEKGAIYIENAYEICTLLEDNTFTKCESDIGGSVYCNFEQLGQIVQQRNSYSESIATDMYMSFCQTASSSPTNKNYAFQISVSKCGESESKGESTFGTVSGDVQIENNNITYNKCNQFASIDSILCGNSSTCNFSAFRENNQTGSQSLRFSSLYIYGSEIQTVSYCNVIGNKCGTNSNQVLFICTRNTTVDHCVFLNNTAVYMFEIYDEGCTLTITDSCIQSNSKTGRGTLKLINENISQFDSFDCFKEPKLMTVKVSRFCSFAEFSIILFTKE